MWKKSQSFKSSISSTAEIAVYSKLSAWKVTAEIELLNIKAQESQENIKQLDNEAYHLLENEVEKNEVTEKLKTNWDNQAKKDETTVYRKWEKRIKEQKEIFNKEKSTPSNANNTTEQRHPNTMRSTNNQHTTNAPNNTYGSRRNAPNKQPNRNISQSNSVRMRPQNPIPQNSTQGNFQKNYYGNQLKPPPRLLPLNSSIYPPSPWQNAILHY